MINIGLVSIDTSHPKTYAKNMAEYPELGLRYAMLYDDGFRSDDEVEWFIKKYNMLPRAKSIDELAEKTDAGFIQGCNWDKKLDQAIPFILRGKPVFIDKPFVGSIRDIKRVRELIAGGAKILGSSATRYAEEVQSFMQKPVEERGEVISVYVTSGNNEFDYAVHAGELLSEIAGARAVSCKYIGSTERESRKSELFTVRFENGVIGTYCTELTRWYPFSVTIVTTKTVYTTTIASSKVYYQILSRLSDTLHSGENILTDIDSLLNVTEFLLCGKRSRDFENGREVKLSELHEDDAFDGYVFANEYARNAKVIYED